MNVKKIKIIRDVFAGIFVCVLIAFAVYLLYLFGDNILKSRYAPYIYQFISNYLFPFLVGLVVVVMVIIAVAYVIVALSEDEKK